ncbi:FtsW/RodA/SpoVE family cell cycle protein [Novosphingobium sp. Gsoil 351]|uniref:FtsW/RodA/SpoVE family cell cycle protein n=1 Tax=Novosphingobium sp. Gsoil 351 TaxID=2675225 RepID=UPI0012B443B4|nr:putative peptidoglycan glycosyltransferase FtsW [Novosphingobium sp. Gsoil 351]QGN55572.1 cell division protein FtsW [Novosphingobium sp. Gsoil 351]
MNAATGSNPPRGVPTIGRDGAVRVVGPGERYRRTRRNELMVWWREIDRVLLGLIATLLLIGVVGVAAGSPASAHRLSTHAVKLDDLHFLWIHLRWLSLGLIALVGCSLMPKEAARRVAVLMCGAMLAALLLVPIIGHEVNGAKRWINLGFSFQPSEFLKPAFAVGVAWVLSWRVRDPNLPVIPIATGLMGVVAALLMIQPDFGATMLFGGVWFVLVLLSGLPLQRVGMAMAGLMVFVVLAYFFYPNATHRIDSFFSGGTAFDQVDLAQKTLLGGGWTGTGLWLGVKKMALPEAHTDYIFSVIGEEFGLIACAIIVLLYAVIAARVLLRLQDEDDLFTILAAAGLTAQLVGQAFINIMVNLQLFPSKGMTLPLISYGGSSMIALCAGVGFLLAITRRNPFLTRDTTRPPLPFAEAIRR